MKVITVTAVQGVLRSLVNESTVREAIERIERGPDLIEAANVLNGTVEASSAVAIVDVEAVRRLQAELRRSQERELALVGERTELRERLERQSAWLSWPQYGEIGAATALRRALLEACGIGLSWTGADTADGRRLRALHDVATQSNGDLARAETAGKTSMESTTPGKSTPKSLLDWGPDGLYDDARAVHLHGHCHAARDGECAWRECPQRKNYKTHCPLDERARDED